MDQINKYIQNRTYTDTGNANLILGSPHKLPLYESTFFYIINYINDVSKGGYWSYNQMVLQFEDIVDMVIVIFYYPLKSSNAT